MLEKFNLFGTLADAQQSLLGLVYIRTAKSYACLNAQHARASQFQLFPALAFPAWFSPISFSSM